MTGSAFALGLIICAIAAVLVSAGLGKLAAPGASREAIAALLRLPEPAAQRAVRLLAVVETLTGVALLVPDLRTAGAVLAGVLGLAFAGAGLLGRARGLATPCGCFGQRDSRPLGLRSVLVGLALAAGALAVLRSGADAAPRTDLLPIGVAGIVVLLAVWIWRDTARELVRPRPTSTANH
ncbi:MauE/DoxX family redox-associated membrane protein [Micromonospora sp. CPCC 205539]|uniref:MauE/DoxX family redox-associated membrane protein n=1 Tax=Micromonospora sp. CPCC 205539 TaxID=3122408 RepID=UPI002FEFC906